MIRVKDNKALWNTVKLGIAVFGFLLMMLPITGYAAEANITTRIEALKVKYPHGKYWNHAGSAADNSDGWTNTACSCHNTGICIAGTGKCTCNHYYDSVQTSHNQSTQCMGFANKLGYDIFGATTWYVYSTPNTASLANIRVGDIIRYSASDTSGHSVLVIAKNGNQVTVGEANYGGKCKIVWGRVLDLTKVKVINYERANNYDTVTGGSLTEPGTGGIEETPTTEAPTTEAPTTEGNAAYTGWQKASDGVHVQYVKKGTILKNKWITVSKKKYYVNKNGYRVTGLSKISSKRYYFNTKGVMQKKKWVSANNEYYYLGSGGYALKSQWLYKGNLLVYVTKDGSMAKGELVKIGKRTYLFNSKGKRGKGFKKCNDQYYYCNRQGVIQKKKWITKSGKKYYLQKSGVRADNKLLKIKKHRYYFNQKGQLIKNSMVSYKGAVYKANKAGHCKFIQYETSEE